MMLPLLPLHSVLSPGVALPLHIFEDRYRLLMRHCLEERAPFGVVLIREGREVGADPAQLAQVGTTALIRQASRYPDGRIDLLTVGGQRFRIDAVHLDQAPYAVAEVVVLEEPVGEAIEARRLSNRVGRRFLHYLEALQPALASDADGPELEVEIELDLEDDVVDADEHSGSHSMGERGARSSIPSSEHHRWPQERSASIGDDADTTRAENLLTSAARRLTAPGDPTALSHLLTGLIQVELQRRQALLEAPSTVARLSSLDRLLDREIEFLGRQLKPFSVDHQQLALRRN